MLLFYILLGFLVITSIPLIRIAIIRGVFVYRLRRNKNIQIVSLNPRLFYGTNQRKEPDLVLLVGRKVLFIKLFTQWLPNTKLRLDKEKLFTVISSFFFNQRSEKLLSLSYNYQGIERKVSRLLKELPDFKDYECTGLWLFLPSNLRVTLKNDVDHITEGEKVYSNLAFVSSQGLQEYLNSLESTPIDENSLKQFKTGLKKVKL